MHKLILILTGVAIASLSFMVGQWWGGGGTSERLMREEMNRWDKLAALDTNVLRSLTVRSNIMVSGAYLMEVWFPGTQIGPREVVLRCENGQVSVPAPNTFNRSKAPQTLSVVGNVVSWTEEGALYEANAKYVGLIEGDGMWGRVYGWNHGDQSVGLWRIYPKPMQTHEQFDQ